MFAFIAFFATASFANKAVVTTKNASEKALKTIYQIGDVTYKVISIQGDYFVGFSCTVTASWQNSDGSTTSVTITNNCGDCTSRQQACDGAFKVASILIPG